jgi:hypothetical protein
MKKYRFLKEGETLLPGDEAFDDDFNGGTWRVIGEIEGDEPITKTEELTNEYRRPIPYTGKVAFLVTYSPVMRVVIDTTGLTDEQIDEELINAARAKFKVYREHHMNEFGDNIDWEKTVEDTECPHIEPQYRFLEVGEKVLEGDLYERSDKKWIAIDSEILPHKVLQSEAGKFQRKI